MLLFPQTVLRIALTMNSGELVMPTMARRRGKLVAGRVPLRRIKIERLRLERTPSRGFLLKNPWPFSVWTRGPKAPFQQYAFSF